MSAARPVIVRELVALAAIVFEVAPAELYALGGRDAAVRARWAVWAALKRRGFTAGQIAQWFPQTQSVINHGCRRTRALGLSVSLEAAA